MRFTRWRCSSWVPCEKLSRATFIPARMRASMTWVESEDGPRVQMIFAFRMGPILEAGGHLDSFTASGILGGDTRAKATSSARWYFLRISRGFPRSLRESPALLEGGPGFRGSRPWSLEADLFRAVRRQPRAESGGRLLVR